MKIEKIIKEIVDIKVQMAKLKAKEDGLKDIIKEQVEDKSQNIVTDYGMVLFVKVYSPYQYSSKVLKAEKEYKTLKEIEEIKQKTKREVIDYQIRVK